MWKRLFLAFLLFIAIASLLKLNVTITFFFNNNYTNINVKKKGKR